MKKMEDKGIVIRTAYNNREWQGPCKCPRSVPRCFRCFKKIIDVGYGKTLKSKMVVDEEGSCAFRAGQGGRIKVAGRIIKIKCGQRIDKIIPNVCVERTLCIEYWWENFGKRFGWRASPDQAAFFTFKEPNGLNTLWGRSKIKEVRGDRKRIFFHPFEPLPEYKRVKGLTDIRLVGRPWYQPTFRYIDGNKVAYLNELIARKK